jgi:hypothetical protein
VGAVVVLVLAVLVASSGRAEQAREQDLKAAFLYHFTQFINWPDEAFADPRAPFVVGILGPDPFGGTLDGILADERVGQRPIELRRYDSSDQIETCHLLFVNRPGVESDEELAGLGGFGRVTVGDAVRFAENGGAIGFVAEAGRITLVINTDRGRAAGVVFSSKLLHLARHVGELP